MKDHPILFSAEMVRAILDDRKTQTRRVVKGQALDWLQPGMFIPEYVASPGNFLSPYGFAGDRLWVREAWAAHPSLNHKKPSEIPDNRVVHFRADQAVNETHYMWRPSIFMPRWASRITLEVVNVRIERLQEISEADAIAEGIELHSADYVVSFEATQHLQKGNLAIDRYARLWDEINGKGAWNLNPWVWVIEFKRVEVNDGRE